ncbi:hypothetical protein Q3G72_027062 [Acer saccharum]|nr:hypothetical protein Q3G72_027062 [Acer saccharum]
MDGLHAAENHGNETPLQNFANPRMILLELGLETENPPTNGAGSASDDDHDHDHGRDVPLPTNSQSLNKTKEVKTSSNADVGANYVSSKFPGPGVINWHGYVTPSPSPAPAALPLPLP